MPRPLTKLLEAVGPDMHCDLCPDFSVRSRAGKPEVFLKTIEGDEEWCFTSDQVRVRLKIRFSQIKRDLGGLTTQAAVRKFKQMVTQALIQEVHSGGLAKLPLELEEEDGAKER